MNTHNGKKPRLLMLAGYLGLVATLLACAVVGGGAQTSEDGTLRLEDGVVEVQNGDGDWVPVAGNATFELVGALEDTDPWTAAGTSFETNELTQIEEGLQVGDLVRVRGTVLEDGTWVAYSIESAEEQTDPILILIGIVDSANPWVVDGMELNVTDETEIQGEITEGMLVRVEILLLADGTWKVLSIVPLQDFVEVEGCVTVLATVVSVEGGEIQFLGWPTTVILDLNGDANENVNDNTNGNENGDEDDDDGEDEDENGDDEDGDVIDVGQTVLAVVCVAEDGTFVIVQITILNTDEDDGASSANGEKVLVCHKPNNKKGGHTLSIASAAVPAHLGHGDTLGPCP